MKLLFMIEFTLNNHFCKFTKCVQKYNNSDFMNFPNLIGITTLLPCYIVEFFDSIDKY